MAGSSTMQHLVQVEEGREAADGAPSAGPTYRCAAGDKGAAPGLDCCWDIFRYASVILHLRCSRSHHPPRRRSACASRADRSIISPLGPQCRVSTWNSGSRSPPASVGCVDSLTITLAYLQSAGDVLVRVMRPLCAVCPSRSAPATRCSAAAKSSTGRFVAAREPLHLSHHLVLAYGSLCFLFLPGFIGVSVSCVRLATTRG